MKTSRFLITARLCAAGAILLLLIVFGGIFVAHTRGETNVLDVSAAPDGAHTLTLSSVGEPDWPFGSAHGCMILREEDKILSKAEIDLAQDGCQLSKDNWSVDWHKDSVEITLRASEQPDEHWKLFFDGRVEQLPSSSDASAESQSQASPALDMETGASKNGEMVFYLMPDKFIECFNFVFEKRNGYSYLKPFDDWVQYNDKTPFYDYEAIHYRYSANTQVWSMPTLSIYLPENGEGIYELEMTFDDHGYQEAMYQEFQEMCICTLSVVLPELSENEITALYSDLYAQTYINVRSESDSGGEYPSIETAYPSGTVGFYGYYGAGTANICIVPLKENADAYLEEQGIDSEGVT